VSYFNLIDSHFKKRSNYVNKNVAYMYILEVSSTILNKVVNFWSVIAVKQKIKNDDLKLKNYLLKNKIWNTT